MDKKLNLPNLDESYYDGIEKIVGSKNDTTFLLPADVLQKRKEFWHDFFQKYAEESVIGNDLDLLDIQDSGPHKKSLKFIQHWVDNGTLPYNNIMDINKESEQCDAAKVLTNTSSSSVDTVAYILSNNNTTNKFTTMAIVEGAKQGSLVDLENEDIGSVDTIKLVRNTDGRDNNDNVLQQNGENSIENASMMPSAEIEKDITFKRNDEPEVNRTPKINYNKLFTEKLMHLITKKENRNSYIKESLINRELNQSSRFYLTEENSECQNDSQRLSQRKKLYSARDSPVDIVSTIRRNTSIIPRRKQFLHPALDSQITARRRSKFFQKRRTQQISMYHKSVMNSSTFSLPNTMSKKWSNTKKSSMANSQSVRKLKTRETSLSSTDGNSTVIECNNQNMNMSAIVNTGSEIVSSNASEFKKPNNTVREFRKSKLRVTRSRLKNQMKLSLSKPNELNKLPIPQNIKPIVCLKRLSESDIRKYKKPKNLTINFDNLLKPVVRVKRLLESDIEKYKKSDKEVKNVENSHSAIYLKQSSQFVSGGSRKVEKMVRIPCNLNATVRLTRLSKRDIENITNSNTSMKDNINSNTIKKNNIIPSTLKNNNLQSQTIQIQNDRTSNTKRPLRSQNASTNSVRNSKTINLFEDSDSDHSTLLIHKCENSKSAKDTNNPHGSSNVSLYDKIGTEINKIRENNVNFMLDDEIEILPKSSSKRGSEFAPKTKNSFIFLFDDSNDFVKLIPRKTNKTFKNNIDTSLNDADDTCSTGKPSVTSESTSSLSRCRVEKRFKRWNFRHAKMIRNVHEMILRNKNGRSPRRVKINCNNDKNNAQTAIQKPKVVNVKKVKNKLDANNLYFRTELFDTDSEASSCY
nr:uncharacterized protein PF11_0213-like isoform X1 [Megalopta genalis]